MHFSIKCPHGVRPKKRCGECKRKRERLWYANGGADKRRQYNKKPIAIKKRTIARRKAVGIINPSGELRRVGRCGICRRKHVLDYDHDHKTGLHRGWLCRRCNSALGWYEKHATRILKYLRRASCRDSRKQSAV